MTRSLTIHNKKGFTLIELLIVVAIIGILAAIAIPSFLKYRKTSQITSISAECRTLQNQFELYYIGKNEYPESLNFSDFSPIPFKGNMLRFLVNNQIDSYDSPDDEGNNQEYWLQVTFSEDPTIQFIVAHSNNVPLELGTMLNGNFRFDNGIRQE